MGLRNREITAIGGLAVIVCIIAWIVVHPLGKAWGWWGSRICTSTIYGTRACRGYSRWAGTFRMWRRCPGIVAGNRCSGIRTCGTRVTNGRIGNGCQQ